MKKPLAIVSFAVLVGALAACALGEPLERKEFQRMGDNVPDGPGLLTGEDGEFVLYRR